MTTRKAKVSRKTLLSIIEEVQKRPCLWNPEDEYHNNRARVAVAWEEITSCVDLPESVIRAKWKNLRDIFKREMKRCKINSQGELDYMGKWRYFYLMWFLHKPKETQLVNCDVKEASNSSTEADIKEEVLNDDEDMDQSEEFGRSEAQFDGNNIFTVNFQPEQDPLPVKTRQTPENDYDLMFLKSLLPYFREMDPVRKLRIRSRIQDIIISEISAQSNCNSTH